MAHPTAVSLVELPDPCLLAVLQYCVDDPASLCSAARAHSRLHQAAVLALSSLSTACMKRKRQVDSLLLYLSKHGQHVDSMRLYGAGGSKVCLLQLAPNLQLTSLHFYKITLHLQTGALHCPSDGLVLATLPLKQLQLDDCVLPGGSKGLRVALSKLPELQYLSISSIFHVDGRCSSICLAVLTKLQHLTHLKLRNLRLKLPGVDTPYLQPLQALTVLREVHIDLDSTSRAFRIGTGMLSASHLKCLCLEGNVALEAGVLADKTELQHLSLGLKNLPGGAARVAQLLSELQHLQQLTYLDLQGSMRATADNPPAAAFSALTASSKLQYLDISKCTLPAGVWQHILPRAGRQLEHLQELEISGVWLPTGDFAAAPDGSRLVSCCPGLQSLCMQCLQSRAEQLAPLQDLSGLRSLSLTTSAEQSNQVLWVVASLTGLRQLGLCVVGDFDQLALLQVTQLKHLTALSYDGHLSGALTRLELSSKDPGDEPVWRQVLRHHLDHQKLEVAQQAAAALAESPLLQELPAVKPVISRAESAVG